MWTPGYWAYGPAGYYWVPGVWVRPPQVGVLWTPGYWGWGGSAFVFHEGYWGPHIGFYGGVNYGFGYGGVGFEGGYWHGNTFLRITAPVTNVDVHVTNVYTHDCGREQYDGEPRELQRWGRGDQRACECAGAGGDSRAPL